MFVIVNGQGMDKLSALTLFAFCFSVVFFTVALTWLLRFYAIRRCLIDIPNHRSSHIVPTPRGGGLAIVITFLFAALWLWLGEYITLRMLAAIAGGGLLVAMMGFWDDHGHVSRKSRLVVHMLAALLAVTILGGVPPISIITWILDMQWLGCVSAILVIAWLTNLYNFMDGIDGIAGMEAVTAALPLAGYLYWAGEYGLSYCLLAFALANLGFLVWNWPPAKIFMGDGGSGFVGFVFGTLILVLAWNDPSSFWGVIILLGVFIVDATVTLLVRIICGEKWYDAHRDHAYQKASRIWGSHLMITASVGLINLLWLTPLALVAVRWVTFAPAALALAYTPLVILAIVLRAGYSDRRET